MQPQQQPEILGVQPQTTPAPAPVSPFFPFYAPSFNLPLIGLFIAIVLTIIHGWLALRARSIYAALFSKAAMAVFYLSWVFTAGSGSILAFALVLTYTRLMRWITPAEHFNASTTWVPPAHQSLCILIPQSLADGLGLLSSGLIIKPPPAHLASVSAVLEMLVWIVFACLVMHFVYVSRKWKLEERGIKQQSLKLGLALVASTVLLSVRGIMQVFERDVFSELSTLATLDPKTLPIVATKEWPIYAFDYLPSILILTIMAIHNPGFYLPKQLLGIWVRP
ncbi:hypothetical protein B0T17DRAFT_614261 [Bombardia bombarda]|uniref:Uncharacterized protein n=1 Tax=Bombardia bombarda TaxID=252184 RepID=A0AA40C7E9_9PEZI|nr:hypothetical protein B0T17DRAFT_614261 [Bombardia bombarda]